jgi:hypothetical protein
MARKMRLVVSESSIIRIRNAVVPASSYWYTRVCCSSEYPVLPSTIKFKTIQRRTPPRFFFFRIVYAIWAVVRDCRLTRGLHPCIPCHFVMMRTHNGGEKDPVIVPAFKAGIGPLRRAARRRMELLKSLILFTWGLAPSCTEQHHSAKQIAPQ